MPRAVELKVWCVACTRVPTRGGLSLTPLFPQSLHAWSRRADPLLMALSEGILRDERALDDGDGVEVVRFTFGTRFTEPFSGYDKEKVELLRVIGHLERVMGKTVRCVLGHSKAATVVCLALGELSIGGERIGAACISGRFDMARGVERSVGRGIVQAVMAGDPQLVTVSKTTQPFWLTRERLEERAAIDMGRAIATMSQNVSGNGLKVCFLVAHGESDERIPISDALAYARAFRERGDEAEVHLIPGADHCFSSPGHRDQLVGRVAAFVHGTVLR